eukprot:4828591-Heterocapsa_arctica.AAC.1
MEGQGCPQTATMAGSKQEEESAMDILGNLDLFGGETRRERNKKKKETFKERTMTMDTILTQTEMGN